MNVVAILGPTASGKSSVAESLAIRFGASILSVDSMQVYRGMDIGTAKASKDTQARIPHHMIDIVDPSEDFSAAEFQEKGREVLARARKVDGRVLIVGGSGLHFRALVDPMTFAPTDRDIRSELEETPLDELQQMLLAIDHHAPQVVDMNNPRRVIRAIEVWRITRRTPTERAASSESENLRAYRPIVEHRSIGLDAGGSSGARVARRFEAMIASGLVDEVTRLAPSLGRTASQAVGYKEIVEVVAGRSTLEDASDSAIRATNALVKRQRTFFARDPRIVWMPWLEEKGARIERAVDHIGEVAGWTS